MPLYREDPDAQWGTYDGLDEMLEMALVNLKENKYQMFDHAVSETQKTLTWGSTFVGASHTSVPVFGKVLTIEEILGPENQWVEEDHKEAETLRTLHEANMMFCLTWARIPLPGKGLMHRAGMFPISEELFRTCEQSGWAFPDEKTLIEFLASVRSTDPELFEKNAPTQEES